MNSNENKKETKKKQNSQKMPKNLDEQRLYNEKINKIYKKT